ncbi:hypothetical protein SAMN04487910_3118 [Aquimarina amphilecti]|uniref:Uncharacterized protein n=1 Tax=Aquimarina amphilecti TaxID=1038014 RepID=A0A1H7SE29_AQUAM|nr:hypothetical protein [Aquimarina amphilecti]SEL70579.1 hypothetical protein SAMN04487910_3118 [Aquimarina amphilecti]
MGAPHNKKKYGELWPSYRIQCALEILIPLKDFVILSGGWAWHFLSPIGHTEYKHAHDHKDIDLFVDPKKVAQVMYILQENGFQKVWTRYDKLPSDENFRRYEKIVLMENEKSVRITIDFFVKSNIPSRKVKGWTIVKPSYLLGLYSNIHSSDKCWAVQSAIKLLDQNMDPLDREELVTIPKK